jgi:hypothetical protein
MALPNRMSLRPGLLWLTLNLALIIQCLPWNNIFISFNFTYPRLNTTSLVITLFLTEISLLIYALFLWSVLGNDLGGGCYFDRHAVRSRELSSDSAVLVHGSTTVVCKCVSQDRAMDQAVSRRPLAAEARIRSRVSPCGVCGGQSGTGTGFSPSCRFSPVNFIPLVLD